MKKLLFVLSTLFVAQFSAPVFAEELEDAKPLFTCLDDEFYPHYKLEIFENESLNDDLYKAKVTRYSTYNKTWFVSHIVVVKHINYTSLMTGVFMDQYRVLDISMFARSNGKQARVRISDDASYGDVGGIFDCSKN